MRNIYLIGNAHLDPVWLWRYPEGCQETRATFRSALERMKEFPEFVFTCAGAAACKWVEATDPDMFREIRRRVAEGRWVIVGGWWVQPDCNAPGGESFARHSLYAQRYFKRTFGRQAEIGYNVDSFGHAAQIPQILRHAGMKGYVMMRPDANENAAMPTGMFRWEGPDGTTVPTYRIQGIYATFGEIEDKLRRHLDSPTDTCPVSMFFYGVGNHGGGPTIAQLREFRELQNSFADVQLRHSSPPACFAAVEPYLERLPVWRGEMQHHASGCYAANTAVKRANRRCEARLCAAELWHCIAWMRAGGPAENDTFQRAWENVLFNQFHDILGGCSIAEAYDDALAAYGESLTIAARAENRALQTLAATVDTRGDGTAVIVFNPHPFPAHLPVEVEINRPPDTEHCRGLRLCDEQGADLPVQLGPTAAVQNPRRSLQHASRCRICFHARLPAAGYRTYRLVMLPEPPAASETDLCCRDIRDDDYRLDGRRDVVAENAHLRLRIDGRTGWIRQLFDKTNATAIIAAPANVPLVLEDRTDTWAHGVFAFREEVGRFSNARVAVIEQGPVRIVVRAVSNVGGSRMIQEYILWSHLPYVEIRARVDWQEELRLLKLAYPVAVREAQATYEVPFAAIERPADGNEESFQRWCDVTGTAHDGRTYGLAVVNDGCASADIRGNEMRLTMLRSAVYAHHLPAELIDGEPYRCMDLGEHAFRCCLIPHAGAWQDSDVVRMAQMWNTPPTPQVEHEHAGRLPASAGFVSVDAANVQLSALKIGEDRDADGQPETVILRAVESHGVAARTRIALSPLGRTFDVRFTPWEVKTLRIPLDEKLPVTETDFLETSPSPDRSGAVDTAGENFSRRP